MPQPGGDTGRFAPSPTGPLHFGSLLAAVASYLDARSAGARWLLRIENIDPPREMAGAAESIVRTLDAYGFEWDGSVAWQHESDAAHRTALDVLIEAGHAYRCGCSRKDLAGQPSGPLGTIYPGTCRGGSTAPEFAYRVRTDASAIRFDDLFQGIREHRLEPESGDFVVRRRDGLIAYQLAVVVDDELANVTRVVRGIDLIDSTPRQIWLQRLLGYRTPAYAHIPVAVHPDGDKLSKLTGARALAIGDASRNLVRALTALRQSPPHELESASVGTVWSWALEHWQPDTLAGMTEVRVTDD